MSMEPASFDMVAAALRTDAADVATYARVLTGSLAEALPAGCVRIERRGGFGSRRREPSRIVVTLGDRTLSLSSESGAPVAEICHEVRGVVLSRDRVGLDVWIEALAKGLVAHADENARAAEALKRLVAGS
jgi:hypothetical protein